MRTNNYLSVCTFQLKVNLDCDSHNEFLIEDEDVKRQLEASFEIIRKRKPDISIFPEMTFMKKYDDVYKELSRGRIIVAGSYYKNGINTTVVYQHTLRFDIPKRYASGAEPMARKISYIYPEEFIKKYIAEHEFWIKGKKVYILNCMEFYHAGYYIARDEKLKKDLFGIIAICSNSNTKVFEQETICIHNHNESIYSFVVNCVGTYKKEPYGDGKSYVYGPISGHEKEWLRKEGIESKKNVCHAFSLSSDSAQYTFAKYLFPETLSLFGRSDKYQNNPREVIISNL